MDAPNDILSWSDGQIEVEIASSIGELDFVCEWVGSAWSARIEIPAREGESTHVVHASVNVDRRLALLDVYGYLWLKEQQGPVKGSVWDPDRERPIKSLVPKASEQVPDPEDLDPREIEAVYGIRHPDSNGD